MVHNFAENISKLWTSLFSTFTFNSFEKQPGFEARTAFTVNSASVFREDVDIVPTVEDDTLA